PQTGIPSVYHSTLESLRLSSSSQNINSQNFKKDMEFMGITVLFLDEKCSDLTKEITRVVIWLLIDL
ncbi:hypothetical protein HID58_026301, partial [Brassica napus]